MPSAADIPAGGPRFESTNAWLDNHSPRKLLSNEPEKVLRATERYRNSSHG